MFHVDSEVGRLRQVVLHRPELELKRLTPDNASELLFDGVLWAERAQAEHDEFAEALVARGVLVHYYGDLLTQTLEISQARDYIMDRVFDSRLNGPLACATLRAAVEGLPSPVLAQALTGGITKQEILDFLAGKVAKWWLPDDIVFLEAMGIVVGIALVGDQEDNFAPVTAPVAKHLGRSKNRVVQSNRGLESWGYVGSGATSGRGHPSRRRTGGRKSGIRVDREIVGTNFETRQDGEKGVVVIGEIGNGLGH